MDGEEEAEEDKIEEISIKTITDNILLLNFLSFSAHYFSRRASSNCVNRSEIE